MASNSNISGSPSDGPSCSRGPPFSNAYNRWRDTTSHGATRRACVNSMAQQQQQRHCSTDSSGRKKPMIKPYCGGYMIRPLVTEWCSDGSSRFNIQDYPIQALTAMNNFRHEGHMCDVILEIQGEKINCHKLVLAACSLYFRGMFTNGMIEADSKLIPIREPSITPETMKILVEFAYTQVIHVTQDNVQSLLVSAIFLEMTHVIEACTLFMEQQLDPSNCISFAVFARQHGCLELEQKATKFIEEHFCDVITYDEILTLRQDDLLHLIGKDELNVRCETQVFKAVIRWVEYDAANRKCYMEKLLQKVRLSSLSPDFLVDQLKKCSIIRDLPHCEEMIVKQVSYLTSHRTCKDKPRKTCKSQVIYIVGGFCRKTMESMTCFECYDPCSKEWNRLPDLPIARSLPGVTSLRGTVYVLGGRLRKCGQDFDSCSVNLYDPFENKWSTRCPMSVPRNRVGVGVLDNLIYAIGGRSGVELFKSAERYDPDVDAWTPIADMRTGRVSAGIAVVNRLLYAVGGTNDKNQRLRSVECYHPERNEWLEVAPLIYPRSAAGVTVLDGYIYAVGGFDGEHQLQSVERYDVKNNVWEEVTPLPRAKSGIQLVSARDKLFTLGGFDGTDFLSSVQSFDPNTNVWSDESTMLSKRSGHGVTVSVAPCHL